MNRYLLISLTLLTIVMISCVGLSALPATPLPAAATQTFNPPTQSPTATETSTAAPTDTATVTPATEVASEVSFINDVMPIFESTCIKCHGGEQTKEGLDLKSYESLMKGSFNGSVIEPGNAQNSYLVQQIIKGEMPKRGGKLSDENIQTIIDWVNAGALNN